MTLSADGCSLDPRHQSGVALGAVSAGAAVGEDISGCLLDADRAADPVPVIPLVVGRPGYDLMRLVVERVLSVNTAAIGGIAQLLGADSSA
jgi:hypothetical protein